MGLEVKHLHIVAAMKGREQSRIVSDLSFSIAQGEKLALVGQSGCGKTMTAMAILGLLPENCRAQGSILWKGQDLLTMQPKKRRALLGTEQVLIPQSGADFLNPALPVKQQMRESLSRNRIEKARQPELMEHMLHNVGFDDPQKICNAYPFQLSGGMAQRVVMAMASIGRPELVIADEPTKGIDQSNTEHFIRNLNDLFSSAAVLLITHDISLAAVCDRILVMKDGMAEEYGDTKQVLESPASLYTHQLICDLPHALSHIERGLV